MTSLLDAVRRVPLMGRIALAAAVVLGSGSLYVSGQLGGNSPAAGGYCKPARDVGQAVAARAVGEVAAFQAYVRPKVLPELAFLDPAGQRTTLSAMRGRAVLLNLWATWCAPCRKEMPALDELQAAFGGPDFEVVAVNIDQRNLERPRAWLQEHGITRLAYYSDPETKIFQDLKKSGQAIGMPTTLLIDANGCQLGVLHGPAEWASDDAKRLISAAIGR